MTALAAAIFALTVFFTVVLIWDVATGREQLGGPLAVIFVIVGVILLCTAMLFLVRRITITVTETHVCGSLFPFRVMRIPLDRIAHVEAVCVDWADAGGIGWRITGRGQYLLWDTGTAASITLTGGATRVIRTNQTAALIEALAVNRD
ncbi:hypothetical protein [Microbacterium mangrovi]|nr:hypothetical protein [Microbacterium mangrovi]